MDEPALDLEGVTLSPKKEVVRVFYKELWDRANKSLIPSIFHADFIFLGSLGPTLIGHEQFAGYVDQVTGDLDQYTTDILAMIEKGNCVSGKMRFHGFHRKDLFGVRARRFTRQCAKIGIRRYRSKSRLPTKKETAHNNTA